MRREISRLFGMLRGNGRNQVIYYEGNTRHARNWKELAGDIDGCAARLHALHRREGVERVGILGPTSYQWMVADLACLRAGLRSVAFPEHLPAADIGRLLQEHPVELLLVDSRLDTGLVGPAVRQVRYRGAHPEELLRDVEPVELPAPSPDLVPVDYSTAFSSGTSERVKAIPMRLRDLEPDPPARTLRGKLTAGARYLRFKRSFWSRKDNRTLFFMPFSHHQQRVFLMSALFNGIDIVLSDRVSVLKHLIVEKPNIMVSVPLIYDLLAARIETKLARLPRWKRLGFRRYNRLRINGWANRSLVKRACGRILFHDLRKLYGGRADYFVTGSAPISTATLRTFYSIGVKLYQGYGLSELGTVALSTDRDFRIGSVGKPCVQVRIAGDSEILVRFDARVHEPGTEVDAQGFIHTGDAGSLDEDGFLYVLGRLDEVIVLRSGEKVFPAHAETRLAEHPLLAQSMVLSRDGAALDAIICLRNGATGDGAAQGAVMAALAEHNRSVSQNLRIAECLILPRGFIVEEGLLTGTLKLRRREIARRYADAAFVRVAAPTREHAPA